MVFNEFANMLVSVLSGGDNTGEFARELFRNITDIPYDVENNPIEDYSNSAWKKYFNGTNSIRLTARTVNPYLDDEKFVTYLEILSDAAREELCDKLKPIYPEVDSRNAAELCASLFKSILIESAEGNKDTNKKINNSILTEAVAVNIKDKKIKEKYELSLLIESDCICPNHNCSENLYILENGNSTVNFKITQIDPNLDKDSFDNLIALCHKCSSKYSLVVDDEKIESMKEIKSKLMEKCNAKDTLSAPTVEMGLHQVFKKIQTKPLSELEELRYEPVSLNRIISKGHTALHVKNVFYITTYYNYVNDLFNKLDKEGKLNFNIFYLQIELIYKRLLSNNLSYGKIYEYLVQWLMNITHQDRESCEIIISYFICNFELDDSIS